MFIRVFSNKKTAISFLPADTPCIFPYGLDAHWFLVCMYDDVSENNHPSVEVCEISNKSHGLKFTGPRRVRENELERAKPRSPWIRSEWTRDQWIAHIFHISETQHDNSSLGMKYILTYNCQRWCEKMVAPFYKSLFTISDMMYIIFYSIGITLVIYQLHKALGGRRRRRRQWAGKRDKNTEI